MRVKNMRTLIVIDMQNDFITGSLGTKEAEAIVPKVVKKIKEAEAICFTADSHEEDYLETQEGKMLPIKHCIKGTDGWKLHPDIEKAVVAKRESGSIPREFLKNTFGSLDLANDMKYWYDKIASGTGKEFEVELVGLCTDICVASNALLLKATVPEMKIYVDSACCAGTTPEKHEAALKTMESCQIIIE